MASESANSDALDPDSLLPNKRFKTEIESLTGELSKGKAPLEESNDELSTGEESPTYIQPHNCGICLSEEGKSVRGYIDSCDHYFCFLCIIEWSKIESRCPLCRARFSTIQRMRRDGTFIGNRSVNVPVRDQISHPLGDLTAGLEDPYAEAKCGICSGSADESVILLCDLCDSAAHTYCVGLGWTVPEGNWYCEGCCLLRAEELNFEADSNDPQASVSVFDIVRDSQEPSNSREIERLLNLTSRKNCSSSLSSISSKPSSGTADIQPTPDAKLSEVESGARTVHRCRNVHVHIRALRENWDAFRRGSLSFSSKFPDAIDGSSLEVTDGPLSHDKPRVLESSSAKASQSTNDGPSGVDMHKKCSYDVDRAWKMLAMAQSMQQVQKPKSAVPAASKNKSDSIHVQADNSNWNAQIYRGQCGSRTAPSSAVGSKMYHSSNRHDRYKSQICEKQQKSDILLKGATNSYLISSPGKFKLSPTRKPPAMVLADVNCERAGKLSKKKVDRVCPIVSNGQDQFSCSTAPAESVTGISHTSSAVLPMNVMFTSGLKSPVGNFRVENVCSESKTKRDNGAKGEIASLVKLNLKILSKHKKLGADVFKEIARLSTHTVLASCGLEHRKTAYSFPAVVCSHGDQIKKHSRSHLMPSICRECFYSFVKDVVSSIMCEKVNCS